MKKRNEGETGDLAGLLPYVDNIRTEQDLADRIKAERDEKPFALEHQATDPKRGKQTSWL